MPDASDDYLSQEEVERSISDTLRVLNEVYVYPEKAAEVQLEIIKRKKAGAYNYIDTKREFRSVMSKELREVSHDSHLSLMLVKDVKEKPTHVLKETEDSKKYNFAFQKLEVLGGNVGYMKFNKFHGDAEAKLTVDHSLGFLRDTDAMIIDLRDCVGGSPTLANYILSHFFAEKTLLWSIHERGEKEVYENSSIPGLGSSKFKSNYPLFLLIGSDTGSAAEFFSYTLKHFGKAKTVGETSARAAHLVSAVKINQYFVGRFSVARPVNPITKENWEGVGVRPDVASALDKSLEVAHAEALKAIALLREK